MSHVHGTLPLQGMYACRTLRFITCSKLASGRALLVGDAAHAMSPNLGMGCNISLQDTLVIDEAIAAAGGDAAAIAQWYSDARRSNAHAVVRISERLDAAMTFKHHRSVLRAALGWPLSLTVGMNYVPRTVPIPGRHHSAISFRLASTCRTVKCFI